jgi:hypothetical protein
MSDPVRPPGGSSVRPPPQSVRPPTPSVPPPPPSVRPPPSVDDVRRSPGHFVAEYLNGELSYRQRFSNRFVNAKSVIGMEVGFRYHGDGGGGGPGGWWILDEPELRLGNEVIVPDLAGWRKERLSEVGDDLHFNISPDWVCEVLSPHSARTNSMQKLPVYLREHVRYVWIVDPFTQSLVVFRHTGSQWLLVADNGGDNVVRAEPFEAIEVNLGRAWINAPGT